jgi:hypothetical protein
LEVDRLVTVKWKSNGFFKEDKAHMREIVRKECKRNRQNRENRVQDTNGMLERKEREHGEGEEGEREVPPEERVCQ